jgi:Beta-propeller repeat
MLLDSLLRCLRPVSARGVHASRRVRSTSRSRHSQIRRGCLEMLEDRATPTVGLGSAFDITGHMSATGTGVVTDAADNLYITGRFSDYNHEGVDFDPGPGVYPLTTLEFSTEVYVAKYAPNGDIAWAVRLGVANADELAVDAAGNVLVAGDDYVSKLDSNGTLAWTSHFDGTYSTSDRGLAVDATGNVYAAGAVARSACCINVQYNTFVAKYDGATGEVLWSHEMPFGSIDGATAVAVDGSGGVHVVGTFGGTVDFNPGSGTFNLKSRDGSGYVWKLNTNGVFVWAKNFEGAVSDIALDSSGIYMTGTFSGRSDFDPTQGRFLLTSAGGTDVFVSKFSTAGTFQWAKRMGGSDQDGLYGGLAITLDTMSNIYLTGGFYSPTADFDPGPGTYNLSNHGVASSDVFVVKLTSAGNFDWAVSAGSTNADYGYGVAVDSAGNVYVTGSVSGTVDFDPGTGIYELSGPTRGFVWKLIQN